MATEETDLETLDRAVDLSFTEPDLYMRDLFFRNLFLVKWKRVSVLQSGV
jgi:hypothetical protein